MVLKEKALAAYRNGIFDIIIPVDNEKDEVDIPTEIREGIRFHKANDMIEVLELALTEPIVEPEVSCRNTSRLPTTSVGWLIVFSTVCCTNLRFSVKQVYVYSPSFKLKTEQLKTEYPL